MPITFNNSKKEPNQKRKPISSLTADPPKGKTVSQSKTEQQGRRQTENAKMDRYEMLARNRDFGGGLKFDFEGDDGDLYQLKQMSIVGTCQTIEKKHYRLTEVPEPRDVRPEPVLKKAVDWILEKFRRGDCNLGFAIDQFKSIRQVRSCDPGHGSPEHQESVHRLCL